MTIRFLSTVVILLASFYAWLMTATGLQLTQYRPAFGGLIGDVAGSAGVADHARMKIARVTATPLNPNLFCNPSASTTVTVVTVPSALSIAGPNVVCLGSPVSYTATPSGPGYTLQWSVTGGTIVAIIRKENSVAMPHPDEVIQAHDTLVVITTPETFEALQRLVAEGPSPDVS